MAQIIVRNLGKAYKRYPSKWSRLAEWLLPFGRDRHSLNWVLQDLNFTVNPGEAVGIIGVNGAGKSTLLKMISGTSQPTTGSVEMTGKVAALLELGIGFHPDFTGRQNAYMAGQLLGYNVDQITTMMPAIEEFAEIGEYIDQPVRFYSSGMQMRLAFSVATADRPDVLIVDEALSVGDTYFTHKCFDRIRKYRKLGTTLLIVSHDKLAIQSICDRAILLNQGKIAMEGDPEAVMDYYNALLADTEGQNIKQVITETGEIQTSSGNGAISVLDIAILDANNNPIDVAQVGQEISLRVLIETNQALPSLVLGYIIKDRLGMPIFGSNTHHLNQVQHTVKPGEKLEYRFQFTANLGVGTYSIALAAHADDNHLSNNYLWNDRIIQFTIVNTKEHFEGVNWMPPYLKIQRLQ